MFLTVDGLFVVFRRCVMTRGDVFLSDDGLFLVFSRCETTRGGVCY